MDQKQRHRIKQAQIYDERERATDYGIGHPGGPTGLRKPRAPQVTGNAARMRHLRKHFPELHALVTDGKLTVDAAMSAAKRPKAAPTISKTQEMELWLGPSHRGGSAFTSEDARRAAWFEHRDRLMELFAGNGRRPMAWWKYESPIPWPGFNRARSTLWAAGLLNTAEAHVLEQKWREEFDRSLEPGFTFQGLTGWDAHIAALVDCDCPAELAEAWAATPDAAA